MSEVFIDSVNLNNTHAINEEISESEMVIVPELKHLGLLEEPGIFINSLQVFLDRYWRSLPL